MQFSENLPLDLRVRDCSGIPLLYKPVSPGQLYRRLVAVLEDMA